MLRAIATLTRFVPATHRQVQQWRLEINGCQGTIVALRGTHTRRTNSVQTFNVGRPCDLSPDPAGVTMKQRVLGIPRLSLMWGRVGSTGVFSDGLQAEVAAALVKNGGEQVTGEREFALAA